MVLNAFGISCYGLCQALRMPCVLQAERFGVPRQHSLLLAIHVQNPRASPPGLGFSIKGASVLEEKELSSVWFASYWMNKSKNGFYIFKGHMLT